MTAYDPSVPRVWKVSPLGRYGALGMMPVLGLFAYLVWGGLVPALLVVLGALALWFRSALRPEVVLTATDVIVRNPGGTRQVRLSDVVTVEPGYGGLTITTVTGDRVVAWAVQKSNLATWTGTHTRADEIAAAIIAASGRSRAETPRGETG